MIETYRGDTLTLEITPDNIVLNVGDKVDIGAKQSIYDVEFAIFKTIEITEQTQTFSVVFTSDEMNIQPFDYILEIELTLTNGTVQTVYQDTLKVKGDVIRNV